MAAKNTYRTVEERRQAGKDARARVPRTSHGEWTPAADRPDPVALLTAQNQTREQDLVPVRHGRMMATPFTFYRGAAKIMASDLAGTPVSGIAVQACGDAHLSNFGVYGSPERQMLFDVNDFDETLPGPWEWDVKRLAASFTIAARNNGFTRKQIQSVTATCAGAYRTSMASFAAMRQMDLWYAHLAIEDLVPLVKRPARLTKQIEKARSRDSLQAASKLTEVVDGERRIVDDPPLLVPLSSYRGVDPATVQTVIEGAFVDYRRTLQNDRKHLLERFRLVDIARKVVGVGSVGTLCLIALLAGRDDDDLLFLQVKEAGRSVLEDHLPASRFRNHGQRVVEGQRLMQAASDVFLGWITGRGEAHRDFYWRQLRDMKGSAVVEAQDPMEMSAYARICAWTLARSHARSGDAVGIAAYLGTGKAFDNGIVGFAERYAEQNEQDHAAFVDAVKSGRIAAVEGL
ncbi:MAG: DUF2252 domain-containing protein [Actinomycetota bacterium]